MVVVFFVRATSLLPLIFTHFLSLLLPFISVEFLGYLNKTCSAGATSAATYGNTAGPILRSGSAGKQWKEFIMDVVAVTPDGDDLVTIKTFFPAKFGEPL